MVVFVYLAPVLTALGLVWFVPGERLSGVALCGAAIVLAVGHHQFLTMGEAGIKALGQPHAVLFDVKGILPQGAADGRL